MRDSFKRIAVCGDSLLLTAVADSLRAHPGFQVTRIVSCLPDALAQLVGFDVALVEHNPNSENDRFILSLLQARPDLPVISLDANRDAHQDADRHANAYADQHTDSYAAPDADAHRHANADLYTDAYADQHTDSHKNTDSYADPDADAHIHANADLYADGVNGAGAGRDGARCPSSWTATSRR